MLEILFFFFSTLVVYGALVTVLHKNPVICALHLAGSMLALAGLFFILGAHFIAGVQVVVYAGAVMVLFVMVVMLFDLNKKEELKFKNPWIRFFSLLFLTGLTAGVFPLSLHWFKPVAGKELLPANTAELSRLLFTDYVFAFEAIGALLLFIAVGSAVLCLRTSTEKPNNSIGEDSK